MGVAVGIFQVGEELDQPKGSTRLVRASAFLHVLVAPAAVIVSGEEDSSESDGAIRIGDIGRVLDRGAVAIGDPSRCIPGGADLTGLDQFGFARVALKGAEPGNLRFLVRVGLDAAIGVEEPSHYAALRSSISINASSGTR